MSSKPKKATSHKPKKMVFKYEDGSLSDLIGKDIAEEYRSAIAATNLPFTDKYRPKIEVDQVNSPPHYTSGGIETIDFIEAKNLNYNKGNAVKYISRAGLKNKETEIVDLEKAIWYLNREIKKLQTR